MSRRSAHYYQGEYSGHYADDRLNSAAAPPRRPARSAHVARRVSVRPAVFWAMVGTLGVMGVWTATTATYFAFRDDVLTRLIARQAEMQFGYEDRIAEMRSRVDRISSRQLLDQEQFEQKLEQMLRRQATLEQRSSALNGLPEPTTTGSIKLPARATTEPIRTAPAKPAPISDKGAFLLPQQRDAQPTIKSAGGVDGAFARLQASLDRVEHRQGSTLNSMEETIEAKAQRLRGVLAELGQASGGRLQLASAGGMGGPFIPVRQTASKDPNSFDRQVTRIKAARADVEHLTRKLGSLPVRKPLADLDVSSNFGVRSDPFTRSPAMHSGIDFHGQMGEAVRVTANGTVTSAGWSGGYGKVIDIDHGNGLSTRYGHLSEIDVKVGQTVRAGQVIGKVGSTGRSTGTHLHYETRIGKEAVDPEKFLRAGAKLHGHL